MFFFILIIIIIYQCDESNLLVLHWFVGNDEDNVMGVVSHDHLAKYTLNNLY